MGIISGKLYGMNKSIPGVGLCTRNVSTVDFKLGVDLAECTRQSGYNAIITTET